MKASIYGIFPSPDQANVAILGLAIRIGAPALKVSFNPVRDIPSKVSLLNPVVVFG